MRAIIATIAWGLFCACSWTWCIGMFLPKLMLDRFGWVGFLVFAIPNVIGCAGFGYVLAAKRRSEEMVRRHGPAMAGFSLIAIAFHMFFIGYLFFELLPPGDGAGHGAAAFLAPLAVWGAGLIISFLRDRAWLIAAGLVYAFSLVAFALVGTGAWEALTKAEGTEAGELMFLAPVICLGFLLCPYLDLTFHRALQSSPSRHAFGVFGLTFAVMITFTCFLWYSPPMTAIGLGHLLAQSVFTVGAHLREMRLSPAIRSGGIGPALLILPLAAALLLPLVRLFFTTQQAPGEDVYIRFLVFYGLAFPAWVLMFIGPCRPLKPGAKALAGFAAVVVVLAPLYEAGFIHRQGWLLLLPAAAALVWLGARSIPHRA